MAYDLYANGTAGVNRPTGEVNIAGDKTVAGTAMLATGVWTHIAATYDGANLRFYVNGALVATKAQTGAMAPSTGPLWIGNNTVYNEPYSGLIDEVRVYNRALSATEIATDRDTPIGGAAPLALRGARAAAPVVKKRLGKAGRLTRDGRKVKAHRRTRWLNGAGSRSRGGRGSRAHRRAAHRRHRAGRRL
jgi:Concanavalin A-like lectin/glucanases superfamily